jgi:PAS domain-containing protein
MNLAARAARLSVWVWEVARDKVRAAPRPQQRAEEQPIAFEDVLQSAHAADREHLDRAVKKAIATGEELDVEYRVVGADGGVRWTAARGRVEKGDGQETES